MGSERRSRRRRRRGLEWAKSLLIVLLAISAVYLTARTQLYNDLGTATPGGWVGGLLSLLPEREAPVAPSPEDGKPALAARPVAIAIHSSQARYGVQYDAAQAERVFEDVRPLFSEALASAKAPRQITQSDWRKALKAPGIYLDFLGEIPLEALYAWLGEGGTNPNLAGAAPRRLVLALGSGGLVRLYYNNDETGQSYACDTSVVYDGHLEDQVNAYSGNGAAFAFELQGEGEYTGIAPYVLILPTPPTPPVYRSANPLTGGEQRLIQAERALAFRPQAGSVYPGQDGGTVIREGKETLQISATGSMTYHASEPAASRYPLADSDTTGYIETTRKLAADTVGAWCGSAQLYLSGCRTLPDGTVEVTYGYSLAGAMVALYDEGYAARFLIQEGQITGFTLHFRNYEETGETVALLPERQAAAALYALKPQGGELALCYEDGGGDRAQPGWVAR